MHTRQQDLRQLSQVRDPRQNPWRPAFKPGHITSHAAGAVIVRVQPQGTVEFLLFQYTMQIDGRPDEITLRCPVETQEDYRDGSRPESPTDSLVRGIGEEIIKSGPDGNPLPFRCEFWPIKPIVLATLGPCELVAGGSHLKLFRMIELKAGELRTEVYTESKTKRGQSSSEVHAPPQWIEAREAIARMERASKPAHLNAIRNALWSLVNCNPDHPNVHRMYADTVESLFGGREPVRVSPSDFPFVKAYIERFPN